MFEVYVGWVVLLKSFDNNLFLEVVIYLFNVFSHFDRSHFKTI